MLFKIKLYVYYPVTKMLVTGYMPKLYVLLYSKKEIKLSKNKKFPVCRRPTWLRVFFVAGELVFLCTSLNSIRISRRKEWNACHSCTKRGLILLILTSIVYFSEKHVLYSTRLEYLLCLPSPCPVSLGFEVGVGVNVQGWRLGFR